ncbi:excalibur calcium-binding domain-containing protein [Amycolatopsis acidiphila]|uniref:Excalibur calcium-binding domain-containing protein n=1 Tax=Amycolatopsis acidiphila TaxID=715473 RepID=A0A558AMM3_9PSEU|nr:excalibur calcium-binding domain-containing protein [Amycolatopsis acidiphila]TVT25509.1 hypothetical protein FNH06_01455 [Amycolatopsis acidiphila]UIJ60251.1 excalibur calcium-binding domain-containing protein [Amycolatopsis acidiphila]
MAMPVGANCYGAETASWASAFLTGKQVTVKTLDTLAMITLSDGTSYSTAAVQGGHAKYLADALSTTYGPALQAAETSARAAGTGLWGPPCHGNIDAPIVITTQTPAPVEKVTVPDPTTHEKAPPASTEDVDVYYANCTEVRAAHAAPIHRGEPGYSRKLDRDGDGIACEK